MKTSGKVNRKANDWKYILRWSKKIKAINYLGGECIKCGNDDVFQLEFHHRTNVKKDGNLSVLFHYRWGRILPELKKCDLLCRNCHQEIHMSLNSKQRMLRKRLLEIKGISKCEMCGYDGVCLDFHHAIGKKDFGIATIIRGNTPSMSLEELILEIHKCKVLCRNCHAKEHGDYDRFKKFKKLIYIKIKDYVERRKINYDIVKDMKLKGMGVCKIARNIGVNRSTISYIFKRV